MDITYPRIEHVDDLLLALRGRDDLETMFITREFAGFRAVNYIMMISGGLGCLVIDPRHKRPRHKYEADDTTGAPCLLPGRKGSRRGLVRQDPVSSKTRSRGQDACSSVPADKSGVRSGSISIGAARRPDSPSSART